MKDGQTEAKNRKIASLFLLAMTTSSGWLWVVRHNLVLLSILYLCVRLVNLKIIPIFNDESGYLDWGWRALNVPGYAFYALYDSKQPLLLWIFGITQGLISDHLFAGRLISVLFGLATLIGIYKIARLLFSPRVAVLSSALYITSPLFSLFDRQALLEGALCTISVWSFYCLIKILQTKKTLYAIIMGIIWGLGFFIKSTSALFFVPILGILLFELIKHKSSKERLIFGSQIFYMVFISQIILIPMYSQEIFWKAVGGNGRYAHTISDLLHFPVMDFINSTWSVLQISFWHLTPLVFLGTIAGIVVVILARPGSLILDNKRLRLSYQNDKVTRKYLPIYFLGSLLVLIILAKGVNTRYLVSFLPFSTILCSYGVSEVFKKIKLTQYMLIATLLITSGALTLIQITNPLQYFAILKTVTPQFSQHDDYVTHWSSGYGIPETVQYLEDKSAGKDIIVGVRLDTGNPENAMYTYFNGSPTIHVTYFDSKLFPQVPQQYDCISFPIPFYFISRDTQLAGMEKFLHLEKAFYKPENSEHFVGVYVAKKDCKGKMFEFK